MCKSKYCNDIQKLYLHFPMCTVSKRVSSLAKTFSIYVLRSSHNCTVAAWVGCLIKARALQFQVMSPQREAEALTLIKYHQFTTMWKFQMNVFYESCKAYVHNCSIKWNKQKLENFHICPSGTSVHQFHLISRNKITDI